MTAGPLGQCIECVFGRHATCLGTARRPCGCQALACKSPVHPLDAEFALLLRARRGHAAEPDDLPPNAELLVVKDEQRKQAANRANVSARGLRILPWTGEADSDLVDLLREAVRGLGMTPRTVEMTRSETGVTVVVISAEVSRDTWLAQQAKLCEALSAALTSHPNVTVTVAPIKDASWGSR